MDEKATRRDLMDAMRLVELQELSITAKGGKRMKPTKGITQQKIDDINIPFEDTPIEVDGVKMQYIPAGEEPELEEPNLEDVIDDNGIQQAQDEMTYAVNYLDQIQTAIVNVRRDSKALNAELQNAYSSGDKQRQQHIIGRLKDNVAEIANLRTQYAREEANIAGIKHALQENEDKKSRNSAEEYRVANLNAGRMRDYENDILERNRGRNLNINRMPNETDEEFRNRLVSLVNETPFNEARAEFEADMKQIILFKKNMKELVRDESVIEEVLKSFTNNDIFQVNKIFPIIKESFLKVYGFDNKNVKSADIIKALSLILKSGKHGARALLQGGTDPEADDDEVPVAHVSGPLVEEIFSSVASDYQGGAHANSYGDYSWSVEHNALRIEDGRNGYVMYLKILSNYGAEKKPVVAFSMTNEHRSFIKINFVRGRDGEYGANTLLQSRTHLNMTPTEMEHVLGGVSENDIINRLLSLGVIETPGKTRVVNEKNIFGWGLQHEALPKYAQFGKIFIMLDKLFYKNILAVKDKNKKNIPSFNNCQVGENFVKLIMKLYKREAVKKYDFDKLSSNEKELYDRILFLSGLHKQSQDHNSMHSSSGGETPNTIPSTVSKHKDKLQVIVGEIEAGNNNPQLLQELYQTLYSLVNLNVISVSEAKRYLNDYKKKYF